jgi:hypothetical protein
MVWYLPADRPGKEASPLFLTPVIGVDLRRDDDVAQCDIVFERARDADKDEGSRVEQRDRAFSDKGRTRVAAAGFRQGDAPASLGEIGDFEGGACRVVDWSWCRKVCSDRLVFQRERGQHDHNVVSLCVHKESFVLSGGGGRLPGS